MEKNTKQKFINDFEKQILSTIKKYKLIVKGDKVIVACSGGKDSSSVLYIINKYKKQLQCKVSALIIDMEMGRWSKTNIKNLKKLCEDNKIPIKILSLRDKHGFNMCYIKDLLKEKYTGCSVCGVIRRWLLNKEARTLKANKIATGHNLDDEAQTLVMNFLKGNLNLSVNAGPITGIIRDKKFIPRIKPLFFTIENQVKRYSQAVNLPILYERCPCAKGTYRVDTRAKLDKLGDKAKENIVKNLMKILPEIRKQAKKSKSNYDKVISYCENCGEPSRNKICKTCMYFSEIKIKK